MAITERLYQFDTKATLVAADIIFCGNSEDSFNEVQTTVDGLIGAYPELLTLGQSSTLTSLEFTSTVGLVGTSTNDAADAGSVGELDSTVVLIGSVVSLTSTVSANVVTLVLQPGDYDVWGELWTAPDVTTTTSSILAGLNIVTGTLPTVPAVGTSLATFNAAIAAGVAQVTPLAQCRISVATATTVTVYLVANVTFATSTMGAYGKIMARRRR